MAAAGGPASRNSRSGRASWLAHHHHPAGMRPDPARSAKTTDYPAIAALINAKVRSAPGDQVLECLSCRGARHLVVPPQPFEQPLDDLPDPGDRVLRVPVVEGADRPLEVQAEVAGDPDVVV